MFNVQKQRKRTIRQLKSILQNYPNLKIHFQLIVYNVVA